MAWKTCAQIARNLTNSFGECSKPKIVTQKRWYFIGLRLPLGVVDRRTLAHGVARVLLALVRCLHADLPCGLRYLPCAHRPETYPVRSLSNLSSKEHEETSSTQHSLRNVASATAAEAARNAFV